jgi:uncharacterized membrane protein YeiH
MLTAMAEPPLLLGLDLTGTFAFALNGAMTGEEAAKLDIVGMLTLGMITALGGGILRQVPTVLTSGLYAIPALIGAAIAVTTVRTGVYGLPAALGAAAACFLIRLAGIRYNINAPIAREDKTKE